MIYAGIDIGSITTKAALVRDNTLVDTLIIRTGYNHLEAAKSVLHSILEKNNLNRNDVKAIISTGYGRNSVDFADKAFTEIICHATGAHFIQPGIRGVIDVGGQDSKAILLNSEGQMDNFAMNDKCAAGTGRFLEVMANALDVELDKLGAYSLQADKPAKISSICTVFAESEVISMIANQEKRENIIAGIHDSAAARVAILASKINLKAPVMMTGGVAKNQGMRKALETRLGFDLIVGNMAQENGAIGAAVLASRI